jgi:hypothetical protein
MRFRQVLLERAAKTDPTAAQILLNQEKAKQQAIRDQVEGHRAFIALGIHSGQSQAQVKSILSANGFGPLAQVPGNYGPWNCSTEGWKEGMFQTGCMSRSRQSQVVLMFMMARRYRDPDSASIYEVREDKLFMVQFGYGTYNENFGGLRLSQAGVSTVPF